MGRRGYATDSTAAHPGPDHALPTAFAWDGLSAYSGSAGLT